LAPKANKIFLLILKLSVSSVLLYIVLSKTGIDRVLLTIRGMSVSAFIFAVMLYIVAQFVSTFRWKLLLPEGPDIKKLFSLTMIGSFFNTLLPGIIGGDAVKGFYLYRVTGNASLAFASIFMDRYLGFAVLIAIGAIAYPFGYRYIQGSRIEWILPAIVLSFIIGSLLFFALRIGQRIRFFSEFYNYFKAYRNQKTVISKAVALSVLVQLAGMFGVYILALGLGEHIPFLAFLIFLPIIILFTTLPISISGLGVREGAFVLFFGLVGIKPEVATAIALLWFLAVSTGSIWGLLEYIKYKKETVNVEMR